MSSFAAKLLRWQKRCGRTGLPWQGTRDPYSIWIAEIMLQQTQVATVIPYYRSFMQRFPDVAGLAHAQLDAVLAAWSGLGYYSRARNAHLAAQIICARHGGAFPADFESVLALPGVGRSTAAAICVFAYGSRHAILDGNVKRVLARCFAVRGFAGDKAVDAKLWELAQCLLPDRQLEAYTQGLMDLGSGVCTRAKPACDACPLRGECVALNSGLVAQLPEPRPRASVPRRATVMLVLQHRGEILLEKRPPSGIWGGLWSLPEIERSSDAPRACETRFGARVRLVDSLPRIDHAFTHFKLAIKPLRLAVTALAPRVAEPAHLWLTVDDALGAAIPAPVRRILRAL